MEERRENGNTRHHEPTYLLANARVANGRRWRKQGASRTKRGRSRWKRGETGLWKIYKEKGINDIYIKGKGKVDPGWEYVRSNVTLYIYIYIYIPLCNSKRERPRGDTRWRSNLFICMTLRNANTLAFRGCGCPRWYPSGYVKFFEPPSVHSRYAACSRGLYRARRNSREFLRLGYRVMAWKVKRACA